MVTFIATVSSAGGAIPDGETVTFKYGATVLGTSATSGGSASISVSTLPVGSDSVVAIYAGDANFVLAVEWSCKRCSEPNNSVRQFGFD